MKLTDNEKATGTIFIRLNTMPNFLSTPTQSYLNAYFFGKAVYNRFKQTSDRIVCFAGLILRNSKIHLPCSPQEH